MENKRKFRSASIILQTGIAAMVVSMGCSSMKPVGETKPLGDDVVISYEGQIKSIIDEHCITCHAGTSPAAGFSLTTYEEVRKQAEHGELLKRINDKLNPMPQGGVLPLEYRQLIQAWADNGFVKKGGENMGSSAYGEMTNMEFTPPTINVVDVEKEGFDLLEKMQGHWIGPLTIMSQKYDWFAFDYRAIDESHVHGIFEGGSMGNLFTSFFVAKYKGKKTIMARNGGLLNGIYRTSYFVLDSVSYKNGESHYRLVDAYGGKQIMWMELTFKGEELQFNSYTSRFGFHAEPQVHMTFSAKRTHMDLAREAAQKVGFPKNTVHKDFSDGLPPQDWGDEIRTSASYIWQQEGLSLLELAIAAEDPYRVDQVPYLSSLEVTLERNPKIAKKKIQLYLSMEPLTDKKGKFFTKYGYIDEERLDGILAFPEINPEDPEFTFTYLHPGKYYITAVADMNGDGYPSKGDISHPSIAIEVTPKSAQEMKISNISVQN